MSENTYPDSQLNQILDYIASVQEQMEIPGLGKVSRAYAYPFFDPSAASLPFFYNQVAGGPIEIFASLGRLRIVDVISMYLCVARWRADTSLAANFQQVARWRDIVVTEFARRVRFENRFSFITVAFIDQWKGLEKLNIGSGEWAGMTFRMHVEEHFVSPVAP